MTLAILLMLLLLAMVVGLGVIFLAYWPLYGAPYVPTQKREIENILKTIGLKKGQTFCDVGCGDGRLVFEATKLSQDSAWGVDVNLGLILWCKIKKFLMKNNLTNFIQLNFYKNILPRADIYYIYLWPGVVEKVADKIAALNIKTLVITKSFEIKHWKSQKFFEINGSRFWAYKLPRVPESGQR